MKRLTALLLLLLLLTGCKAEAVPETTQAPPPTESTSGVHTDYSAYQPHQPMSEVYTRLSEDFMDGLTPSEDYGAVYPFCGDLSYELGADFSAGQKYGIVTQDGMIVCDPVYDSADLVSYFGYSEIDGSFLECYYPIWSFSKTHITVNDSSDHTYMESSQGEITLISLDGSRVLEHTYRLVQPCETALICRRFSEEVIDVLDFEGNLMFSTETMTLPGPLNENAYSNNYTDGLLIVTVGEGYDTQDYYLTTEGEVVLGPYASASAFFEGRAVVSENGNDYHYIDREGNRLNDTDYYTCNMFYDGYAVAYAPGSVQILDLDGNCVLRFPEYYSVIRENDGFTVTEDNTFYDYDLQAHPIEDYSSQGLYAFYGSSLYYRDLYLGSERGFEVVDVLTGEVVYSFCSEKFESFSNPMPYTGDYFTVYEYDADTDITTTHIIGLDFVEQFVATGPMREVVDQVNKQRYFCVAENGTCEVYAAEDGKLLFEIPWRYDILSYYAVKAYDGKLFLLGDTESLIYDMDGTLLFRYRLPSFYGD